MNSRRVNVLCQGDYGDRTYSVDPSADEHDIRRAVPNFFNWPGRRNSYACHRGFIIASYTRELTGCRPERIHNVYAFLPDARDTMFIAKAPSVRAARAMIDRWHSRTPVAEATS